MTPDMQLLGGAAALVGAASALLYARKRCWPEAALAAVAGAALAGLLLVPQAGPGDDGVLRLNTDASPVTTPDAVLAAALAQAPQASSLEVTGHGLHEAQWRDLAPRTVRWSAPSSDRLWLDFPRSLALGRPFTLTVRRSMPQPGWRLQLLAENGQQLAESRASGAAPALSVQWQPPLAEQMVLRARVLGADGKMLAEGPVPLRVEPAVPLQLRGRFGAPSFDAAALNRLLADSSAVLDWQTTLGKSLTRSEEAAAAQTRLDAQVADAAWLERGGLRAALTQVAQGVPLLILGGNAGDAPFWQRELGLTLVPQSATTEQEDMRHLAMPGATLALAAAPFLPAAGHWQVAARDPDGKPWLWQRNWQQGRLYWLGVRDWHRYAISEPAALGHWWQQVLDRTARAASQPLRWLEADPLPLPGLRTEVCAQGAAPGEPVQVGGQALRWLARAERADAACVAIWPAASGWLALRSGTATSALYVFAQDDWPAWQQALRSDATARYAALAAQPVGAQAHQTPAAAAVQQALPRWLLALAFAGCMLGLWWRERR